MKTSVPIATTKAANQSYIQSSNQCGASMPRIPAAAPVTTPVASKVPGTVTAHLASRVCHLVIRHPSHRR